MWTTIQEGALQLLAILGIWTAASVLIAPMIAPLLSRRLRRVNFPIEDAYANQAREVEAIDQPRYEMPPAQRCAPMQREPELE